VLTRRRLLQAGAGAMVASYAPVLNRAVALGARTPDSLPDPTRAAGEPTSALPFDHIVIVMMENHSFDNYLGMLPRRGQPAADGFDFDAAGNPVNSNPYKNGYVTVQHAGSHCQPGNITQNWRSTHLEMNGGRMDGFANVSTDQMVYWDEADLPFYYSLAKTFCVGDRWFCSAPCQTYPNRRFLLAATAFGLISTDTSKVFQDPPNGTIVDRLDAHGITWRDYFTDVPATGVIASIPEKHPANLAHVDQFYVDCAAGTLPQVSFVDSDIGLAGQIPSDQTGAQSESEENPADISLGENFVARAANAVLSSPLWPRILMIWFYDEHGGYYDHVPPPAAIPPDNIPPQLGPNDPPGGYDIYGPRVPAVVLSGYAKRNAVTSVVHDHTSVLATIQAKWNLPAMTHRDANATTMADFLVTGAPSFPEPPKLATPSDIGRSEQTCSFERAQFTVHPNPPAAAGGATDHLVVRWYGRRHAERGVVVALNTRTGSVKDLVVELLHGKRRVGRLHVAHVATAKHRAVFRGHFAKGRYTLVVKQGARVVVRRTVRVGRP
jgi:phospholipase C